MERDPSIVSPTLTGVSIGGGHNKHGTGSRCTLPKQCRPPSPRRRWRCDRPSYKRSLVSRIRDSLMHCLTGSEIIETHPSPSRIHVGSNHSGMGKPIVLIESRAFLPPPTYLLRGPLGRSKPDLPTYCIGSTVENRPPIWLGAGTQGSGRTACLKEFYRSTPSHDTGHGRGLARTGTNTGTPREPPKRLLQELLAARTTLGTGRLARTGTNTNSQKKSKDSCPAPNSHLTPANGSYPSCNLSLLNSYLFNTQQLSLLQQNYEHGNGASYGPSSS